VTRVLALDIGTSSVRAVVHDERGEPLAGESAQTKYELTHGYDGRADFDADHLVDATRAALEQAIGRDEGVGAIGVSCFWHGLLAVDSRDRAITPLVTWRDTRSAEAADALRALLDPEKVHRRTGAFLHASYWPAKLAWLRSEQRETFERASRYVSFSDYLYGRLLGSTATSLSMASATGLLNQQTLDWDEELLEVLGLRPEQLPEISDDPVEHEGRLWYPAIGDGAAANVGAGATSAERAVLMVGTSGAFRTLHVGPDVEPRPRLFLYRLDERYVVEGGALSDGGNLYSWLDQTLRLDDTHRLAEREPAAHGLTFLALLGGERSPNWNARARGAVAGLSFDTTPADLLQAALEGVAFRFAEVVELMPEVREIVAAGHALVVDRDWVQILADVLERPLTVSPVEEASARGAAVAALERLGGAPDPPPAGRLVEPRAERFAALREARERQRDLYYALNGDRSNVLAKADKRERKP
jgi:gluconokinase